MRRRRIGNKTLLAASLGAATLSFGGAGCEKKAPMRAGNLMAPPMVEICVTTDPPGGEVTVAESTVDARGCATVMQDGEVVVTAELEGYETKEIRVPTDKPHTFTMRLQRAAEGDAAPAPDAATPEAATPDAQPEAGPE